MNVRLSKELQEDVLKNLNIVDTKIFLLIAANVCSDNNFDKTSYFSLSRSYIIDTLDLKDRFITRFKSTMLNRIPNLTNILESTGIILEDTTITTTGINANYHLDNERFDKYFKNSNNGYYILDLDILKKFSNRDTNTFKLFIVLMRLSKLTVFKKVDFKQEFQKVCPSINTNFNSIFKLGVSELKIKGLIYECTYEDKELHLVIDKPKEELETPKVSPEKQNLQESDGNLANNDMEKFNMTYNKLFGRTVTKKEFNEFVSNYNSCHIIKNYSLDGLIKFLEDYVELGYYNKDYGSLKPAIFTNPKQGLIVENVVNGVKKWVDKKTPQKSCSDYSNELDNAFTAEEMEYQDKYGIDAMLEKFGHRFDEEGNRISYD